MGKLDDLKAQFGAEAIEQAGPILDMVQSGDITVQEFAELMDLSSAANTVENIKTRVKIIQAMIDFGDPQLSHKDIEDLKSDPDSDFWGSQDIDYIVQISNFFRNRTKSV